MENSRARSECCLCAMKMLSDNVRAAAAVNLVFMLWPRQEHYCMQMKSEMEGKTTWSTTIYNCKCVCVCVNLPVRLAAWRVAAGRAPSPLCGLSLWTRTFVA